MVLNMKVYMYVTEKPGWTRSFKQAVSYSLTALKSVSQLSLWYITVGHIVTLSMMLPVLNMEGNCKKNWYHTSLLPPRDSKLYWLHVKTNKMYWNQSRCIPHWNIGGQEWSITVVLSTPAGFFYFNLEVEHSILIVWYKY